MTKLRTEFLTLGRGKGADGTAENVIHSEVGTPATTTLTTGTLGGSPDNRITVPAGAEYVRYSALEGDLYVATGADPTAAAGSGLLVFQNTVEFRKVTPGELIDAISLA